LPSAGRSPPVGEGPHRVFLLSPANSSGKRAGFLFREGAASALALRLRSAGASIGDVYTFMSGLYFRGQLAYARAFANPPGGCIGIHVIVPGLGLHGPDELVDLERLRAIAEVPVDPADARYVDPLRRDAILLAGQLHPGATAILLGSLATRKYLGPLREVFGDRLQFPREFVGIGDMSRGSLMLRCAAEGRELTYVASLERPAPVR
jgi:hypothetical protein